MRFKNFAVLVLLVPSLLVLLQTEAQGKKELSSDWSVVKELKEGTKLVVHLKDEVLTGKLKSASETGLFLIRDRQVMEILPDQVERVQTSRKIAGRLLIGLGIGAGGGAVFGRVVGNAAESHEGADYGDGIIAVPIFAGIGAGVGTLVGWLSGYAKDTTIYKAPPSSQGLLPAVMPENMIAVRLPVSSSGNAGADAAGNGDVPDPPFTVTFEPREIRMLARMGEVQSH
jgi:hypothetical protein